MVWNSNFDIYPICTRGRLYLGCVNQSQCVGGRYWTSLSRPFHSISFCLCISCFSFMAIGYCQSCKSASSPAGRILGNFQKNIFDSTSSQTCFCLSLGYFCLTCWDFAWSWKPMLHACWHQQLYCCVDFAWTWEGAQWSCYVGTVK